MFQQCKRSGGGGICVGNITRSLGFVSRDIIKESWETDLYTYWEASWKASTFSVLLAGFKMCMLSALHAV